jgi:putative SOS response-associated peptidase YedK
MCGRFVSASPPDEIARYFDAVAPGDHLLEPNYNVAPTDDVYAVIDVDHERRLEAMHWGLVPMWAESPSVGSRMINARAETIMTKNAFRPAFEARRCLIPADGFYEWQKLGGDPKRKQPMFIRRADDAPLAFAGLWEVWRDRNDPKGGSLRSATIITTQANETMAPIHDRMPVILAAADWEQWLDPGGRDLERLRRLLVPTAEPLALHPVSTAVNNVRNDGPELIAPVELPPVEIREQGTLL